MGSLTCLCLKTVPDFEEGRVYEYQYRRVGSRTNLPDRMYILFSENGEKVVYTNEEKFLKCFEILNPKENLRIRFNQLKRIRSKQ
jgi:hypothetical protein